MNLIKAIEGELENALFKSGMILQTNYGDLHKIGWSRSSRTDKGVHSLSTIFSAKLEGIWKRKIYPDNTIIYDIEDQCQPLPSLINQYLPSDIRVIEALPVSQSWDARKSCTNRSYQYLIPFEILKNSKYTNNRVEFDALIQIFVGRHHWHNYGKIQKSKTQIKTKFDRSLDKTEKSILNEEPSILLTAPRTIKNEKINYEIDENDLNEKINYKNELDEKLDEKINEDENFENEELDELDELDEVDEEKNIKFRILDPIKIAAESISDISNTRYYRTISSIFYDEVTIENENYIRINLTGESFLLHQVRRIVGMIIAASKDLFSKEALIASIDSPFRIITPRAPPQGLFLNNSTFQNINFDNGKSKEFEIKVLYPHIHQKWLQTKSNEIDPWIELNTIPSIKNVREVIPSFDKWYSWHLDEMVYQREKKVRKNLYNKKYANPVNNPKNNDWEDL